MSGATIRTTGVQVQTLPSPFPTSNVAYLPTELWTNIIQIVLYPDLSRRTCTNVLPLLLVSNSFKAIVNSTREYQYLRNARLRMRHSFYSSACKLFQEAAGKYVAILPGGGENVSPFTTKREFTALMRWPLSDLRWALPGDLREQLSGADFDQVVQAAKDCAASRSSAADDNHERDLGVAIVRFENHDEIVQFMNLSNRIQSNISILQALPDLPKAQTTVAVDHWGHCSCNGTDENIDSQRGTWDEREVLFLGSAEYMYWLCKEGRDLKLPHRRVSDDDYDAKGWRVLYETFVKWYETGKLGERRIVTNRDDRYGEGNENGDGDGDGEDGDL
ncbi:hypothetical protein HDV00_009667 [Rhizophlyctis rosea]|nr:hypothetical protein HDV00_009667 [Rhizophlyctis rosea]